MPDPSREPYGIVVFLNPEDLAQLRKEYGTKAGEVDDRDLVEYAIRDIVDFWIETNAETDPLKEVT